MDPSKVHIPPMKDLTIDNITENTILINSQGPDARLTFLMERLVTHLHDFARETRLSSKEWKAAVEFLTAVGQTVSDIQEFVLLSDAFGLSLLIDSIDHPKPAQATEGSVLGPFHTHEAELKSNGEALSHDPDGEPWLMLCTTKDTKGQPIEGVKIDIWESDSSGHYDVEYPDRPGPDGRGVMKSDKNGVFWFKAIRPMPYPIPHEGPVGKLLERLHRHAWRPSHVHFMFDKPGFDPLITALYLRDDPYATSDAVFGVKDSLLVDLVDVDGKTAKKYDVKLGSKMTHYDFVLVSEREASDLRAKRAKRALADLGRKAKLLNGLPVPDVD